MYRIYHTARALFCYRDRLQKTTSCLPLPPTVTAYCLCCLLPVIPAQNMHDTISKPKICPGTSSCRVLCCSRRRGGSSPCKRQHQQQPQSGSHRQQQQRRRRGGQHGGLQGVASGRYGGIGHAAPRAYDRRRRGRCADSDGVTAAVLRALLPRSVWHVLRQVCHYIDVCVCGHVASWRRGEAGGTTRRACFREQILCLTV